MRHETTPTRHPRDLTAGGPRRPARRQALKAVAAAIAALAYGSAAADAPRRVLIIHSFGRDFAPFDATIAAFRRELASRSAQPVVFVEASLDAARPISRDEEAAFVAYLVQRFSQPVPDLVVSSGGPAARFLIANRARLFVDVPILLTAQEARVVSPSVLKRGDGMVASKLDLKRAFEHIVQVLPDTTTIAVVLGDTPLERFWRKELEREASVLAGKVRFVWFDGQTLAQMKDRIADLPANSAVFYAMLLADAAGVPYERFAALAELRSTTKVPFFALYENEVGQGVVGGPVHSQSRVGREAAEVALRLLNGPPDEPIAVLVGMDAPIYDARELRRWEIDDSRLPPGSTVRFDEPSMWRRHRDEIVAAAGVIFTQAALIAALLVQRARTRRAEADARTLSGRLITAHEDEGRRLARELHDDITQRLAGVSLEAATLGRLDDPAARQAAEQSIGGELAALSRDVHALSYRLHPSVIDDLGLGEALRIECERAARRSAVSVDFHHDAAAGALRGERALGLFRIGQEALRNALRHGSARQVRVELREEREGLVLTVSDDGCGFDPHAARARASLGLASMRERAALLHGRLEIRSRPGEGTRVTAWVPAWSAAGPEAA
jgi:signal transduction histidine kinase